MLSLQLKICSAHALIYFPELRNAFFKAWKTYSELFHAVLALLLPLVPLPRLPLFQQIWSSMPSLTANAFVWFTGPQNGTLTPSPITRMMPVQHCKGKCVRSKGICSFLQGGAVQNPKRDMPKRRTYPFFKAWKMHLDSIPVSALLAFLAPVPEPKSSSRSLRPSPNAFNGSRSANGDLQ